MIKKMLGNDRRKMLEKVAKSAGHFSVVDKSLDRLATIYIPNLTEDGHKRIVDYCKRILASRLEPAISGDEMHLVSLIQKKLAGGDQKKALRFASLYAKLVDVVSFGNK
jgi:transcriptional regulator NrdR family protein